MAKNPPVKIDILDREVIKSIAEKISSNVFDR